MVGRRAAFFLRILETNPFKNGCTLSGIGFGSSFKILFTTAFKKNQNNCSIQHENLINTGKESPKKGFSKVHSS